MRIDHAEVSARTLLEHVTSQILPGREFAVFDEGQLGGRGVAWEPRVKPSSEVMELNNMIDARLESMDLPAGMIAQTYGPVRVVENGRKFTAVAVHILWPGIITGRWVFYPTEQRKNGLR